MKVRDRSAWLADEIEWASLKARDHKPERRAEMFVLYLLGISQIQPDFGRSYEIMKRLFGEDWDRTKL